MAEDVSTVEPVGAAHRRIGRRGAFRPGLLNLGLFFFGYLAAAAYAQYLAIIPASGISIWPAAGVFVAALLLSDRERWPFYIAAALAAELLGNLLWFKNPGFIAVLIFVGNALTAVVGAVLVKRFSKSPRALEHPRDVLIFILCAAIAAPVLAATVGSATLDSSGIQSFADAWPLWWTGDATGVLLAAPLILSVVQERTANARLSALRIAEAVALGVTFLAAAAFSLGGSLPFAYIVMPPLIWAAARFEFRGVALIVGLLAVMTAIFTVSGASQFAGDEQDQRQKHLMLQLFLGISAFSAIFIAVIARQHRLAMTSLRQSNVLLERTVAERTEKLEEAISRQRLLINELDHRVKNTLATVQAIASQTFRSEDHAPQTKEFYGRLGALAAAHDLLARERWEGARMADVVQRAVLAHCGDGRVAFDGPDIIVPARHALALSLALHELCTNASKYGALSTSRGRVDVEWTSNAAPRGYTLRWKECDGPVVSTPTRTGFGIRMIRHALSSDLDGTVDLTFEPEGVACVIDALLADIGRSPITPFYEDTP